MCFMFFEGFILLFCQSCQSSDRSLTVHGSDSFEEGKNSLWLFRTCV